MNHKLRRIGVQLLPYFLIGMAISATIGLLIILSSLILWGMLIGSVIWVISLIKNALFPSETSLQKAKGRIIEHNNRRH